MRKTILILVSAALLLAGCAEDAKRRAAEADARRQALYHQKCLSYGLTPGTDAYASCRQRFDALDRQEKAMKRTVILNHLLMR